MIFSLLRFRRPSKQTLFVTLMGASAVSLLLPREVLGPARSVVNLVALAQWPASAASRRVADFPLEMTAITPEQHSALVSQLEAQQNRANSLAVQVAELRSVVQELTHLRELPGFPRDGRLIPAQIIASDAVASRGSLLLSKGTVSKARVGDWVTSRRFIDSGSADGTRKDAAVLAHETLLGWVEATEAFTSRVVLLSDNLSGHKLVVHIIRQEKDGTQLQVSMDHKPLKFSLEGAGSGLMRIPEVSAQYVQNGIIRAGDLVMSNPNEARLPVSLVIGEIVSLDKVVDSRKKPLYYTAIVRHRVDPQTLSRVFIADFSRDRK